MQQVEIKARVITISGASASGKTTLFQCVQREYPNVRLLTSYTTRAPRPSDLPGEYEYVSEEEFDRLGLEEDLVWTIAVHGNRYATPKQALDQALAARSGFAMKIVTPDVTKTVQDYAPGKAMAFYLRSPGRRELLRRMVEGRGEDPFKARKRIRDSLSWDKEVERYQRLGYHVHFLNPAAIRVQAEEVIAYLRYVDGN